MSIESIKIVNKVNADLLDWHKKVINFIGNIDDKALLLSVMDKF